MNRKFVVALGLVFLILISVVLSETVKPAPENIAAALLIKLAAFETHISTGKEVTIYVLYDTDMAREFATTVGKTIGKAVIKEVILASALPFKKPEILYIGENKKLKDLLTYTRANKVLSVTSNPDLVKAGVTLGVGIGEDNKPAVILNLTSSAAEDQQWNPAIMKIASTVK